jgi:hypothetical protein
MVKHVKVIVEKHPDGYVAYPLGLKRPAGLPGPPERVVGVERSARHLGDPLYS